MRREPGTGENALRVHGVGLLPCLLLAGLPALIIVLAIAARVTSAWVIQVARAGRCLRNGVIKDSCH